jgi:mRNA interferase RelE/StbE
LTWKIEFDRAAERAFLRLDSTIRSRIRSYLDELSTLSDPHLRGKGLVGDRAGLWRYRVGDYRVICRFENDRLIILVVEVGHRSSIYD